MPVAQFSRYALNIGAGPDGAAVELPQGGRPWLPFGLKGAYRLVKAPEEAFAIEASRR